MKPPVVILSGIRWDFLWQRHQTLATLFARAGHPTVFVETTGLADPRPDAATLRKLLSRVLRSRRPGGWTVPERGPTVYSPLVAPPTHRLFRRANAKVFVPRVARDLRRIVGREPVVVAYPPTRTTLDLISALDPRLLLYDRADDYESFPGVPPDIAETERELLLRADLVSCTSAPLLEEVRPFRPDAFLSGPGVDYEKFAVLQAEPASSRVRTVCFFGHVTPERLDLRALRAVAKAGFTLRLVGGVERGAEGLLELPGVDHRGEVPHAELPTALSGVDAFVLPYRLTGLTRHISPAKTYECLATGRPVVCAPLPAMVELREHVYLAAEPEDYARALHALPGLETDEKRRARTGLARANSWEARFEDLEARLWQAL